MKTKVNSLMASLAVVSATLPASRVTSVISQPLLGVGLAAFQHTRWWSRRLNVMSDINVATALLHGEEDAAFGDSGGQEVHKRTEAAGPT